MSTTALFLSFPFSLQRKKYRSWAIDLLKEFLRQYGNIIRSVMKQRLDQKYFDIDNDILRMRVDSLTNSIHEFASDLSFDSYRNVCAAARTVEHALDGVIREFGFPNNISHIIELLKEAHAKGEEIEHWNHSMDIDQQQQHAEIIRKTLKYRYEKFETIVQAQNKSSENAVSEFFGWTIKRLITDLQTLQQIINEDRGPFPGCLHDWAQMILDISQRARCRLDDKDKTYLCSFDEFHSFFDEDIPEVKELNSLLNVSSEEIDPSSFASDFSNRFLTPKLEALKHIESKLVETQS